MVKRHSNRRRLTRKLNELRDEMLRCMHTRFEEQHRRLRSVLLGDYSYYAEQLSPAGFLSARR